MGFRVGHQCVATQLMADDLVLSVQPPLLTETKVLRPIRGKDGWYYEGQKVQLYYPHCSEVEQIRLGTEMGAYLVLLFVVVYLFRLAIHSVQDLTKVGGDDN